MEPGAAAERPDGGGGRPRPGRQQKTRAIRSANAEFQLLEALVGNRNKRHRQGRFLVQGVRGIEAALASGWPVSMVLLSEAAGSAWALGLAARAPGAERVILDTALLGRLSERDEGAEAVLVAATRERAVTELTGPGPVVVVEGAQNPGNLGTIFRSALAFGAAGLVVTGHGADPYDPRCVRASSGALFHLPFVAVPSVAAAAAGLGRRTLTLDPRGRCLDEVDLDGPIALVCGNERTGASRTAWATSAELVSIPVAPPVDSLNVAVAVSVGLAEVARRRRGDRPGAAALRSEN